jgi:DNA-binding GntR family transcriptional regulator
MAERANSKAEQVYLAIKESILTGAFEPGAPIDKLALCDRLGVSRFPVSAAISRLAFEQLVVVEPQHGSFVARISMRDVKERLFIRRALEGEVVAEAARRFGPEDLDALRRILDEAIFAAEVGDRGQFYALDVAFHAVFTQKLGLLRSAELLDALRVHLERVRRLLMAPAGRINATIAEHAAIIEGLQSRDPDVARRSMETHMNEFSAICDNFARERPDLFTA